MVEDFKDSTVFTATLKKEMKEYGVSSVEIDAITADTSAKPATVTINNSDGDSNSNAGESDEDSNSIVIIMSVVLIGVFVVSGAMIYLYFHRKRKNQKQKDDMEQGRNPGDVELEMVVDRIKDFNNSCENPAAVEKVTVFNNPMQLNTVTF